MRKLLILFAIFSFVFACSYEKDEQKQMVNVENPYEHVGVIYNQMMDSIFNGLIKQKGATISRNAASMASQKTMYCQEAYRILIEELNHVVDNSAIQLIGTRDEFVNSILGANIVRFSGENGRVEDLLSVDQLVYYNRILGGNQKT